MTEVWTCSENYVASLTMPSLCVEVYADAALPAERISALNALVECAWPIFLDLIERDNLYEGFGADIRNKALEAELIWCRNESIQTLNRQYRDKDAPTDVLSFPLAGEAEFLPNLPVLSLGSIVVSVEYAEQALADGAEGGPPERYLLERMIHGMLHLLGMHHDTMAQYETVTSIQRRVLDAVFSR